MSTYDTASQNHPGPHGSKDGDGAADHDQPYRFGSHPSVATPFPFSDRQFARLLVLRSRRDEVLQGDEPNGEVSAA